MKSLRPVRHISPNGRLIAWAIWAAGVTAIILIFSGKVEEEYERQLQQVQQEHIAPQTLHVTAIENGEDMRHQPHIRAVFADESGKEVTSRILSVHTNIHVGETVEAFRLDESHFLIQAYDSGFPTSLKIIVISIAWGVVVVVGILGHRREKQITPGVGT